ncbi:MULTISPECIES: hypothetical protein [Acinetobacter]|uniref:hypothetical protein n=1 Tax=Acinetobacter TaxID=469 RepID=UPI00103BC204|nr:MULTISPECIES: hypothetical protein [Acinetobacter]TCB17529.1 hypothetical protein E0H79_07825 [Acinetobacter sp. ANC 5045]
MKKILFVALLAVTGFTYAAPNVWQSDYAQGFSEYSIQDVKGNTLWVTCNEGAGDMFDHSVRFQTPKNSYANSDSKYPLTFLLDGKTKVAASASTKWRNGANAWYELSQGISKAKKIDVYLNNKKVTTFTPNQQSIKSVAKHIAACEAMF